MYRRQYTDKHCVEFASVVDDEEASDHYIKLFVMHCNRFVFLPTCLVFTNPKEEIRRVIGELGR